MAFKYQQIKSKFSNFWLRHFVFGLLLIYNGAWLGDWGQNRQILIYSLIRVKMTPRVKIEQLNLLHYFYSPGSVIFTPLEEIIYSDWSKS